jgi:hypothetical protein
VDLLNWVVKYGEQLSIVSILMIVLVVVVVGLYRKWWVPGWMYEDCTKKLVKLEASVEEEAQRLRVRIDTLESLRIESRRSQME